MVTPDTNTNKHLEDSVLLAYIRQQQLDDRVRLRISQHIDIEQCPRCCHTFNELSKISKTLSVLEQMQAYQHYPELSVADTFERVKIAASKRTTVETYLDKVINRQRPRRSAVRLISLPVAFALAILFTVAMLVFANLSIRPWIAGLSQGGTNTSQNLTPSYLRHQSTPTPNLSLTATARVGASATPVPTSTPTVVHTGPYLEECLPVTTHWRLIICGYNFEADSNVVLIAISGKVHLFSSNILADKQGNIQVEWYIGNCVNLPTTVLAYAKIDKNPIVVRLQDISLANCPPATPTVGPRNGPGV